MDICLLWDCSTEIVLFFAAILGGVLAGCSKNEVPETNASSTLLSFNAVTTPVTKAVLNKEIPVEYNQDENFTVYAYKHPAAYVNGTTSSPADYFTAKEFQYVTGSPGSWKGKGQAYYWPKDDSFLSFMAYSPSDANANAASIANTLSGGFVITDYQIPAFGSQYDLMVSERSLDWKLGSAAEGLNKEDSNLNYYGVDILFHHILSSIQVMGKTYEAYQGVTVTFKNLTISNLLTKGTFTQSLDDDASTWKTLTQSNWGTPTVVLATPYDLLDTSIAKTNDGSISTLHESSNALFAIPQVLTDDVIITLEFDITQDGKTFSYTDSRKLNTITRTTATTWTDKTWQPGYRYIYTYIIKLDEIVFDPAVTDFVTVECDSVTL